MDTAGSWVRARKLGTGAVIGALVAALLAVVGPASPAAAAASDEFTAITPYRVLDTRDATGADSANPIPGGFSIDVTVVGVGDVPASGVEAVVMNVTSTAATEPSFVTVWPTGEDRPTASSLNTEPGQDTPNLVVAAVGDDGKVSFYHSAGTTHLVADIVGYYGADDDFTPVSPLRALDTRNGTGGTSGPVLGGTTIELDVSAALFGDDAVIVGGIRSVIMNVTSTEATAPAFVTVFPTGENRPLASSLNAEPGQDTPNLVYAKVGDANKVSLYVSDGSMHLLADIVGYTGFDSVYRPITPARAIDTRQTSVVGAGETIDLTVAGVGDVPDADETAVGAVVMNVTSTESTEPSFVTVHPFGEVRPNASNLNTEPGQDTPNLVIAKVVDGKVSIYNNAGQTHLVVDIVGWFPLVQTPKEIVLGSASGSKRDFNGVTTSKPVPLTRNDIETSRSGRRVEVFNGKGPLTSGNVHGEAYVWVDFPAHRSDAVVTVDVGWKGSLVSFVGANSNSGVQVIVRIIRVSNGAVVGSHTFEDSELGLDAIEGLDTLNLDDREARELPVTFVAGEQYRIELELDCQVRVAFSVGATTCGFGTGDNTTGGAWINSWKVTFDEGV